MKNNLQKIRLENDSKIEDVAEILNISKEEYMDKESGVVSLSNNEKNILSNYYGKDIFKNNVT